MPTIRESFAPLLPTLAILLAGVLHAGVDDEEEVQTRISVLAIGDPPLPRYEMRNDMRHVLETPAAEHPPGRLYVRNRDRDGESFKELTLGINIPMGYITYRGQRKLVLYRDDGDSGKTEFTSLELPELRDDLTVFLLRERRSRSWLQRPTVRYFDNSQAAFPNDSVRLINLSSVPVLASINGDQPRRLAAGRSVVVRIPRQEQGVLAYKVAAEIEEQLQPLLDSAITTMPDTRFNLVIYDSDGAHARSPVNIAFYFERTPELNSETP